MDTPTDPQQNTPPIPWAPDVFLPKVNSDGTYGYYKNGKLYPCEKDELIRRHEIDDVRATQNIEFIWTPESGGLIHVAAVPWLHSGTKKKMRQAYAVAMVTGVCNLFLTWRWIASATHISGLPREGFGLLALAAFFGITAGILPFCRGAWGIWQVLRPDFRLEQPDLRALCYNLWLSQRTIRSILIVAAVIVGVFIAQIYLGMEESIAHAGVTKGEGFRWWQLVTGPLLHGGILHISFNILAFIGCANSVSRLTRQRVAMAVFVLSMVAGTVFSVILLPGKPSVGMSGGIMGLIGFLLVIGYKHRAVIPVAFFKSLLFSVLLIALLGLFAYDLIDNAGHAGGLLCGLFLGAWWVPGSGAAFPLAMPRTASVLNVLGWIVWIGGIAGIGWLFFGAA